MKREKIASIIISGFKDKKELVNELQQFTDENGCMLNGYRAYYPDDNFKFPVELCCNKSRVRVWLDYKTAMCLDDAECKKVYIEHIQDEPQRATNPSFI